MRRSWRLWFRADDGSTIAEVVVASAIMAVAVLGVLGSMGSGMGLVGHSRQRSAGAGVAQERLERARNIAYTDVALDSDDPIAHNPQAGHPDNNITTDNLRYRLPNGVEEPLVLDPAGGLKHLDDPFTLANTDFTVHQYVTWVDDPAISPGAQDYKRVTVIVRWKFPVASGPSHTVVQSTYVTDGTVNAPSTPTPTPTATTSAQPSASPSGGLGDAIDMGPLVGGLLVGDGQCATDQTPPTFTEMVPLSGSGTAKGYLNSTSVEIRFSGWDPECHPVTLHLANTDTETCPVNGNYTLAETIPSVDKSTFTVTWSIPSGDGVKSICAHFKNKALVPSNVKRLPVELDQTKPGVPPSFQQLAGETGCVIDGNDRAVTLRWTAPSPQDTNFYGYRVYRSLESTAFALVQQTDTLSISDTTEKNYSSVRYLVRAYDKAGNESADSTILSYARNRC